MGVQVEQNGRDRLIPDKPGISARVSLPTIMRVRWEAHVVKEELPAFMTPMQAVAWIVARDPKIVRFADTRQRRTTAEKADFDLPVYCGISMLWLALWCEWDRQDGYIDTPQPDTALSDLVGKLQCGHLHAHARRHNHAGREEMSAMEWHDLTFDSERDQPNVLTIHHLLLDDLDPSVRRTSPHQGWRDPIFKASDIKAIWPGRVGDGEEKSASARLPDTPKMTAHQVLTWIGLSNAKTLEDFDADRALFTKLWRSDNPKDILCLLEGMAHDHPFCPIDRDERWPDRIVYTSPFLSHRGPEFCDAVVSDLQNHYGKPFTVKEAAEKLRSDIELRSIEKAMLDNAEQELFDFLHKGKIIALGIRPGIDRPEHENIPVDTVWNDLEFNRDNLTYWTDNGSKTLWKRVTFRTDEVRILWPDEHVEQITPPLQPVSLQPAEVDPIPTDQPSQASRRSRSPYRASDLTLCPELHELITGPEKLPAFTAAMRLADKGRITGYGENRSRALRLIGVYTDAWVPDTHPFGQARNDKAPPV